MTGTHDKLRGLFLAALMVLSIIGGTVAFTGTVAATTNAHFNNFGATSGETTAMDAFVYANASENSVDEIQISFEGSNFVSNGGSVNSITDGNVQVKFFDGSNNTEASFQTDATVQFQNDSTITVHVATAQDIGSNWRIRVRFTDNFQNPSAGDYTGTIDIEPGTSNNPNLPGNLHVDQPGAGDGERELTQGNTTLVDGSTHYIGQKLLSNASQAANNQNWEPGEVVTLKDDSGNVIATRTANSTGYVLFNTRQIDKDVGLTAGDHFLEGEVGNSEVTPENVSFVLLRQDLSANFNESTVEKGETTTLTIRSQNRVNYNVSIESDDLSADEIQDIFSGPNIGEHTEGVDTKINGNDENLTADFSDISTGDYSFHIRVVDARASDNDSISVVSDRDVEAELNQSTYQVPQGDLVRFRVDLSNTQKAELVIGDEDTGYETVVNLNDGDEDGKVVVVMNTYIAGRFKGDESQAFQAVDSDDTVTANLTTNELPDLLDQGDYVMSTFAAGNEKDVATLIVDQRSTQSINISTAPANLALRELEDIEDARDDGDLTADDTIAEQDMIVHRVRVTGVFGAIANATGEQTEITDNDFETLFQQSDNITLTMEQTNPDRNTQPKELDLSASSVSLIADENNGSVYLVVDSGSATFRRAGRTDVYRAQDGDRFKSTFNVSKDSLLVGDNDAPNPKNESVTARLSIVEREGEFDLDNEDNVTVWSPDNEIISGTTTIAPGSEVRVRARSTGDEPFLKTATVDVQPDGTFEADLNFSDVDPPANFTATLNGPEGELDEEDGRVIARPTASVTMNDQTVDAGQVGSQTLTVASVSMNYGGFVTIHDQTLQDGQTFASVRGTSDYLTPGSHQNVKVKLSDNIVESQTVFAMPHRDTDDDTAYTFVQTKGKNDAPYTVVGGGAVTDSASITVETPTATPSPTPTQPPATPTQPPTPSPTPTETPTPTQGQTPGFGITVAVISLAAAALLARRRLN